MRTTYQQYPLNFPQEAIALLRSSKRPTAGVASSPENSDHTLRCSVREVNREEARIKEPVTSIDPSHASRCIHFGADLLLNAVLGVTNGPQGMTEAQFIDANH